MFDLEQAICEWRQQMLAAGIQTPVPMKELESHLREEIECQLNSGVNEQLALGIALQIIGNAKMLQVEFEKNQFAKEMRDWKLKEKLVAGVLSAIILLVTFIVLSSRIGSPENNLTNPQQMSVLAAQAVMIALVLGGRLGYRLFPVISTKRIRNAICISGSVTVATFWIYWFNFVLPRYDYTVGQVAVAVLWNMMLPGGILAGLISGIETVAWKKREKDLSLNQN